MERLRLIRQYLHQTKHYRHLIQLIRAIQVLSLTQAIQPNQILAHHQLIRIQQRIIRQTRHQIRQKTQHRIRLVVLGQQLILIV
jgi:hypothetical protein